MSDTVINRPVKIKAHNTLKGKGLTIERIYTKEGVHPYDEVKWERRDVVQQNWKTGETVFEQRGVEFADFWSVNASTISAVHWDMTIANGHSSKLLTALY
jgi:ribonucleoside-diphosphate reductase alpha chain